MGRQARHGSDFGGQVQRLSAKAPSVLMMLNPVERLR
jgi:hypothetical protein